MWNKLWKQELFNVTWGTKITLSLPPTPVHFCEMSRGQQLQLNIESIRKSQGLHLKSRADEKSKFVIIKMLLVDYPSIKDTWNELCGSQSRCQQSNAQVRNSTPPTPSHDPQSFQESREDWSEPQRKGYPQENLSFGTEIVECKKKYLKGEVYSLHGPSTIKMFLSSVLRSSMLKFHIAIRIWIESYFWN